MLYVVELRRERDELSAIMARIREWLDKQRFVSGISAHETDWLS